MKNEIFSTCLNCQECNWYKPANKEEPIKAIVATYPFEIAATDLGSFQGMNFCAVVDKYSGHIWCSDDLKGQSTKAVTDFLERLFYTIGLPQYLRSDNGPCYRSFEFAKWCEENSVDHITSSPHYPKSNGQAENAIKICKKIMKRQGKYNYSDFQKGLRIRNNTPVNESNAEKYMASPAQMFFSRRTRTELPTLTRPSCLWTPN